MRLLNFIFDLLPQLLKSNTTKKKFFKNQDSALNFLQDYFDRMEIKKNVSNDANLKMHF